MLCQAVPIMRAMAASGATRMAVLTTIALQRFPAQCGEAKLVPDTGPDSEPLATRSSVSTSVPFAATFGFSQNVAGFAHDDEPFIASPVQLPSPPSVWLPTVSTFHPFDGL